MNIPFATKVAESLNGGFDLIAFIESLGWFYFEPLKGYTNDDYDQWIELDLKNNVVVTNNVKDETIRTSRPYPMTISEALEIFDSSFWSYGQELPINQEELGDILLNYSKFLIRKHDSNF